MLLLFLILSPFPPPGSNQRSRFFAYMWFAGCCVYILWVHFSTSAIAPALCSTVSLYSGSTTPVCFFSICSPFRKVSVQVLMLSSSGIIFLLSLLKCMKRCRKRMLVSLLGSAFQTNLVLESKVLALAQPVWSRWGGTVSNSHVAWLARLQFFALAFEPSQP